MRTWMVPWLLPAGMIGAVVLVSLNSLLGGVAALVWGLVVLPAIALKLMRRSPEGLARLRDLEANYWRMRRR
jgi:hypothetical protein